MATCYYTTQRTPISASLLHQFPQSNEKSMLRGSSLPHHAPTLWFPSLRKLPCRRQLSHGQNQYPGISLSWTHTQPRFSRQSAVLAQVDHSAEPEALTVLLGVVPQNI